ncbi:MAG: N-acetylmuramic acid 6-phosphate etherase [Phycisphaerales bacterium]|nr:N-acetylmuramic acid 6-phosphate etherase [Phycisphaerales bacterium]
MTLPPDRSHILAEQRHPATMRLHEMDAGQLVQLFNDINAEVQLAMDNAAPLLAAFVRDAEPRFLAGGRLIYLGAGTSGRLGVLDASECPPTFQVPPDRVVGIIAGGDSALRKSSEGKEDDPLGAASELDALNLSSNDTILGIAAGGTTPYVLGAIAHAKRSAPGSLTGLLTCSPVPKPADADHLIVIATGPELLTGSTRLKAGTATKLALNTISTTLMIRSGRVFQNLMVDLRATNDKLRDRAARIISTITGLSRPESLNLLDRAGGIVKVAIVMHTHAVDRDHAERLLQTNAGRL